MAQVLDRLPKQFREQLRNIEIVIEARPSPELLREEDLDPRYDTLYGIYQGVPLTERSRRHPPMPPTKLPFFRAPNWKTFPDPEDCASRYVTVLHEIAHYFGMDRRIEDLDTE